MLGSMAGDLILTGHGCSCSGIHRKGSAMAFAAWVILGVVAGWIACSIPADGEPHMGRLLVGVLGAVLGGVLASLVGVGSAATFFSVGAWLVALGGATTLLLIQSLVAARCGQRRSPSTP
jgi:uncharacterized membrane protein YeaQ/YmgE (transglycosylase-associated protein family)